MSNSPETVTADGERGPSSLMGVLAESAMIAKIMVVWTLVAIVPLAYILFIGGDSALGLTLWAVIGFIVVLGLANVLLYVIARGVTLAQNEHLF